MPTFKHECGYAQEFDVLCPQCGVPISVKTTADLLYALMAQQINQDAKIDTKVDK